MLENVQEPMTDARVAANAMPEIPARVANTCLEQTIDCGRAGKVGLNIKPHSFDIPETAREQMGNK
jgi:hypothetical protein